MSSQNGILLSMCFRNLCIRQVSVFLRICYNSDDDDDDNDDDDDDDDDDCKDSFDDHKLFQWFCRFCSRVLVKI